MDIRLLLTESQPKKQPQSTLAYRLQVHVQTQQLSKCILHVCYTYGLIDRSVTAAVEKQSGPDTPTATAATVALCVASYVLAVTKH
jgi:hypothetical protein